MTSVVFIAITDKTSGAAAVLDIIIAIVKCYRSILTGIAKILGLFYTIAAGFSFCKLKCQKFGWHHKRYITQWKKIGIFYLKHIFKLDIQSVHLHCSSGRNNMKGADLNPTRCST